MNDDLDLNLELDEGSVEQYDDIDSETPLDFN